MSEIIVLVGAFLVNLFSKKLFLASIINKLYYVEDSSRKDKNSFNRIIPKKSQNETSKKFEFRFEKSSSFQTDSPVAHSNFEYEF